MQKFTFGYLVNDREKFNEEVLSKVSQDMISYDESKPYTAFAMSVMDEFGKIERIEAITQDSDLTAEEKLEKIEFELYR